ncbi:MAG: prepilin-type N-terminal cleavage/methylation domain-containing protein [Sedimentisphaerales bacterium]|jgi:prepilin-type N-terminal cleavage/methylation domain-containing protein
MNFEHQITSDESRATRHGFSLTEVLIAVGILAVGMMFIASAFPVSVYFTTVATERTIAPVVADEAFAKLQILWPVIQPDFNGIGVTELSYPSTPTPTTDPYSKKYWWSFLYNKLDPNEVMVFVFRKAGTSSLYRVRTSDSDPTLTTSNYPTLISVSVSASPSGRLDELMINDLVPGDGIDETSFINGGYTIVDTGSGRMYRVFERYYAYPNVIRLDKDWIGTLPVAPASTLVWVTSPPVSSGRYPCIGVYQKTMRF